MASTSVDHPEVERPIHIDYLSRTREYSFRAEAADGLSRAPINPADSVWDQLSQIPPSQPALTVNAGAGPNFVERVAMVLRPVAGSKLKWEFASWVGDGSPNPPSEPISRVIPASFGNKDGLPGAYQPTLTGAPAYDGHTWVVDGLNHYVEFPYGTPAGLAAPVLTFYRYTGTTGGQGASTIMYLNRAVYDEAASINIYVWPSPTFIGSEGEYDPSHRIIPKVNLYPVNSTFSFEASGLYRASVRGADLKSRPQFGIMVGDYAATNGVLGLITLELDPPFYDMLSTWSYKLIATQVESNPSGPDGLRFIWTSEATMCLKGQDGDIPPELFVRKSSVGDTSFGSVQPVPDGYQFSVHAANLDLPSEHTPGPGTAPSITVYKFNHVFKQIA